MKRGALIFARPKELQAVAPAEARGGAGASTGRRMEYASWCESRTCIALAVCR